MTNLSERQRGSATVRSMRDFEIGADGRRASPVAVLSDTAANLAAQAKSVKLTLYFNVL